MKRIKEPFSFKKEDGFFTRRLKILQKENIKSDGIAIKASGLYLNAVEKLKETISFAHLELPHPGHSNPVA